MERKQADKIVEDNVGKDATILYGGKQFAISGELMGINEHYVLLRARKVPQGILIKSIDSITIARG